MPAPVVPEVGVLALVPEEWGGPWMARHQLLTRLARYFHVAWVPPARGWRELWLGAAPDRLRIHLDEPVPANVGFSLYRSGRFLPRLYRPRRVGRWLTARRLAAARRVLTRRGARHVVLHLFRPEFDVALDLVPHALSVYHVLDEYSFSDTEHPTSERERLLLERVDQVIVHSPGLLSKKGGINPRTMQLPNGVDFAAFERRSPEPADMASIPRPRLGYVGVIKRQLDLALLDALAARHGEWSFVLVGPTGDVHDARDIIDRLRSRPNVHFMGPRRPASLPGYVHALDVALLCYRETAYTQYIYPLKLHETLAAGRPIVATPIRSLEAFGDRIELARGLDEWSAAVTRALAPDATTPASVALRRETARAHDWDALALRLAQTIGSHLAGGMERRLAAKGPTADAPA